MVKRHGREDRMVAKLHERFRLLEEMREPFKDVPSEDIEREATRAIAEVRREMRDKASSPSAVDSEYGEPNHKDKATGGNKSP